MRRPWSVPLLVSGCLLGGCGGGDVSTRVCFGSEEFCEQVFADNRAPEADAGDDREVSGGATVTLDGSASRDPDGRIDDYAWSQETGPAVALSGASTVAASFAAPDVTAATTLTFRLLVVDDDGASDADNVTVTVVPSAVAALHRGVETLAAAPPACTDPAAASRCWSYLGLWLGARVIAARILNQPDDTVLLDTVRVIEITQAPAVPTPRLNPAERQVFELGQRAVADFTEHLDPATAERARRLAPGPPPQAEEWRRAVRYLEDSFVLDAAGRSAARVLLQALEISGDRTAR